MQQSKTLETKGTKMNQTYPCYKMARKAAEKFGERLIGLVASQTMSVSAERREILQQWTHSGHPETRRAYFRWEGECNGY